MKLSMSILLILSIGIFNVSYGEVIGNGALATIPIGDFGDPYYKPVNEDELEDIRAQLIKAREDVMINPIPNNRNTPKNLEYKSDKNSAKYKAKMNCLMSDKTAEECNSLFL